MACTYIPSLVALVNSTLNQFFCYMQKIATSFLIIIYRMIMVKYLVLFFFLSFLSFMRCNTFYSFHELCVWKRNMVKFINCLILLFCTWTILMCSPSLQVCRVHILFDEFVTVYLFIGCEVYMNMFLLELLYCTAFFILCTVVLFMIFRTYSVTVS